jgi:glucuronate isomerase
MSLELRRALFAQLDGITLIDPHSHIQPLTPGSRTLADLLGYHYYTELVHSAGLPRAQIEAPRLEPREKVRRIVEAMQPLENTIQYSWFIELAQTLFGFADDRLHAGNWEALYDVAEQKMSADIWPQQVLMASNIEAVFLTNEFDDPLTGFDTNVYIPCLRTDDLVFHFAKPEVRERLEKATWMAVENLSQLHEAIGKLFEHFVSHNARACAISLPPDFAPYPVSQGRAATALSAVLLEGLEAAESHRRALSNYLFWLLADHCNAWGLPFDLMIGVNRGVYEGGVHQGRDLYDSRVSLHQYKELFNAFPDVVFPISVLASVTNQELTSYAWIFPNVVTNGHWWYSNTPTFIEHDLAARLEAVPSTKQIGYYSDMYKLEFGLPKFAMYKRILAKVLAERFVIDRGWSEQRAVELGRQVLRGNVEQIFMQPLRPHNADLIPPVFVTDSPHLSPSVKVSTGMPLAAAGAVSALASTFDTPAEGETLSERLDFVVQPTTEEDDGDHFSFAPPASRPSSSEFRLDPPPGSDDDLDEPFEEAPMDMEILDDETLPPQDNPQADDLQSDFNDELHEMEPIHDEVAAEDDLHSFAQAEESLDISAHPSDDITFSGNDQGLGGDEASFFASLDDLNPTPDTDNNN